MMGGLARVRLLLSSGIAAVVGSRALRLGPIVGCLMPGFGLSASGTRRDAGLVQEPVELGLVFLVFDVGLSAVAAASFPRLRRLAAVSDTGSTAAFAARRMKPVVDDGPMPGLALAAAVLRELDVAPGRIETWATSHRNCAVERLPAALAVSG